MANSHAMANNGTDNLPFLPTEEEEAQDLQDLLELEKEGASVTHTPASWDDPVVVPTMPMAQPEDDNRREETTADNIGNYSTEWLSRRAELQEIYELEESGANVIWQDPQDRIASGTAIRLHI